MKRSKRKTKKIQKSNDDKFSELALLENEFKILAESTSESTLKVYAGGASYTCIPSVCSGGHGGPTNWGDCC